MDQIIEKPGMMTVTIPRIQEHEGYPGNLITISISNECPKCLGKRGKVFDGLSYDGSRRLNVSCWVNPCGHVDTYVNVVKEYYESQEPLLKLKRS